MLRLRKLIELGLSLGFSLNAYSQTPNELIMQTDPNLTETILTSMKNGLADLVLNSVEEETSLPIKTFHANTFINCYGFVSKPDRCRFTQDSDFRIAEFMPERKNDIFLKIHDFFKTRELRVAEHTGRSEAFYIKCIEKQNIAPTCNIILGSAIDFEMSKILLDRILKAHVNEATQEQYVNEENEIIRTTKIVNLPISLTIEPDGRRFALKIGANPVENIQLRQDTEFRRQIFTLNRMLFGKQMVNVTCIEVNDNGPLCKFDKIL